MDGKGDIQSAGWRIESPLSPRRINCPFRKAGVNKMKKRGIGRQSEPEVMDDQAEAEVYARADFNEVNQVFAERLAELAAGMEEAVALDLGTGPGDIPLRILRLRPRWRIAALDASAAMLALGQKAAWAAGAASLSFIRADAKNAPFCRRTFDVIFSNSILHHVADVKPFWAELARVAKSGALVLLRDLARPASREEARLIVETYSGNEPELLKEEFYRSLLAAYTPAEVKAQLVRAGIRGLKVEMIDDRHLDVWGRVKRRKAPDSPQSSQRAQRKSG